MVVILYIFNTVNIDYLLYKYSYGINTDKYRLYIKDNLINDIRYLLNVQIHWFLGGHGGDILDPVTYKKSYLNVFCNIGGAGSTVCLIIAILVSNSYRKSKDIAKISVIPSIFNVNEIVVYGLPVLLNPISIIPLFHSYLPQ